MLDKKLVSAVNKMLVEGNAPGIDALARECGMSRSALYRAVKQSPGLQGPIDLVRLLATAKAYRLLHFHAMPVRDVSTYLGDASGRGLRRLARTYLSLTIEKLRHLTPGEFVDLVTTRLSPTNRAN